MSTKRIALIAHDNKKKELVEWTKIHLASMQNCEIYATGTTGRLLADELGLTVHRLHSGPLGGDQQIGAIDCRGQNRHSDIFLGSPRTASTRSRYQGTSPFGGGLEHPGRL